MSCEGVSGGGRCYYNMDQQQGTSADDVDVDDDTNGVCISSCLMTAVVRMITDGDADDDGDYGEDDMVVVVAL